MVFSVVLSVVSVRTVNSGVVFYFCLFVCI